MKVKYKVSNISCTNCVKTIKNTIQSKYPESEVKVNINTGTIFINNINERDIRNIKDLVSQSGYPEILEQSSKNEDNKLKRDLNVSIILSLPLLIGMFGHLSITSQYIPDIFTNHHLQLIFASVIQFYIGRNFYISAYHGLKNKVLGMDFLVALGSSTAYFYSIYILLTKESTHELYFEVSALIITIVLIGKYLEHKVKTKTATALESLIDLNVKEVTLVDGSVKDIEFVEVGEHLNVLANEKIPLDSKIIDGETYVDESAFTGESEAVKKVKEDEVIGGSMNVYQKIEVEVLKDSEDSLLNQIVNSVEEASLIDTQYQRIADKVASIFVPVVLTISLITFLVTLYITNDFSTSFEHAISVIVISCPCALGLATPTSIMVSNGLSAQRGILYKGGAFFEIADQINIICFDKTGTITKGKPEITYFDLPEKYIQLLYSIESQSNHPISKSISQYLNVSERITDIEVDFEKGKGIISKYENDVIRIGNSKIINNAQDPRKLVEKSDELQKQAMSVNFIIINEEITGIYAFKDTIKEDSKLVIDKLKQRNITPVMITGDNKQVARVIADEVGITEVHASTLPIDKSDIVKKYMDEENIVCFVGDGINDSVALARASIGISVKNGSDIAVQASDVTLLHDDLNLIIDGIDLSKATRKNIKQNFLWAFSYNIVAIPLAAFGYLNMVLAALTMGFSSIVVVLNALRLKKFKFEENKKITTLKIKNMNCQKCVNKITKLLIDNNITYYQVTLENKTVSILESDLQKVSEILQDNDYII